MNIKCWFIAVLLLPEVLAHGFPGGPDASFTTPVYSTVQVMVKQSDGKILVGGGQLVRLNPDGTQDGNFSPLVGGLVSSIAVQNDGGIIIVGAFNSVNGYFRQNIARLNASGSLDFSFDPGLGPNDLVNCVAVQNDGKILIGGSFSKVNGVTRNFVARLNSDGSLDQSFNNGTGANNAVKCLAIQTNGAILIGGSFTSVNGTSCNYIARLNSDASLDLNFNPGSGPSAVVFCILIQSDGNILIGGEFFNVNGNYRNCVARLNSNGSLDTSFIPPTSPFASVNSLAIQNDGKVLAGGYYYSTYFYPRLVRIHTNGAPDSSFNFYFSDLGMNNGQLINVYAVAIQNNGKVLVGSGSFFNYLYRLRGDAPFIDNQPISQTVLAGGVAAFSSTGSGIAPLFYRWQKDGVDIPDATGSTISGVITCPLNLTNIQPSQTGNYSVIVTNSAGSVTSSVVSLSLYGAPLVLADNQVVAGITTRNYSAIVSLQTAFPNGYIFYTLDGTTPTFASLLYTGPFTITNSTTVRALSLSLDFSQSFPCPASQIKILKNSLSLSGGGGYINAVPLQPLYESGSLVTLSAIPDSGWTFDHWEGSAAGASNPVAINLNSSVSVQAVFTTTLQTNTLGSGHIEFSNPGPFAYGATIQIRAIPDSGKMFVLWGGAVSGTVNPQPFTVNNPNQTLRALFTTGPVGTPNIITQPTSQVLSPGSLTTLTVGTGSGSFSYQWRLNGSPIANATTSVLTLTNMTASLAGDYDVVVNGGGVSVVSSVAKVMLMDFGVRPVVSVIGSPGTPYRVDYSETLTNGSWQILTNGVLTSPRQDVIDFTNSPSRYYRVIMTGN